MHWNGNKNRVKTEHVCPYKKIYCNLISYHDRVRGHFLGKSQLFFLTDYRCADVLHVHLCVCWVLRCVQIPSAFDDCRMCAR